MHFFYELTDIGLFSKSAYIENWELFTEPKRLDAQLYLLIWISFQWNVTFDYHSLSSILYSLEG